MPAQELWEASTCLNQFVKHTEGRVEGEEIPERRTSKTADVQVTLNSYSVLRLSLDHRSPSGSFDSYHFPFGSSLSSDITTLFGLVFDLYCIYRLKNS